MDSNHRLLVIVFPEEKGILPLHIGNYGFNNHNGAQSVEFYGSLRGRQLPQASTIDNQGQKILNASFVTATPFSYGSGHVNPNAAADPGLIYDLKTTDYLNFLCSLGYNSTQLASFESGYQCPSKPHNIEDLNYPSFAIYDLTHPITVSRRMKNVGPAGTYIVTIEEPSGIRVKVEPSILRFDVGEEKKFMVTFHVDRPSSDYVFGSITWSDGTRFVRSPVAVLTSSWRNQIKN